MLQADPAFLCMFTALPFRDIFFYRRSYRRDWTCGFRRALRSLTTHNRAGGRNRLREVQSLESIGIENVVRRRYRLLPIALSVSPTGEPFPTSYASPVPKMDVRVDTSPMQPLRQLRASSARGDRSFV
jgi:hypothetical protein